MARNVASYMSLGFTKIKVRVGIGAIKDDERRLAWLRDEYGDAIRLSADANGAWAAKDALSHIDQLAKFGLDYIEQPTVKGDWPALEQVARLSALPVMIDEGLQDEGDVERVCANQGRITAHLKIAKAGGVRDLVGIARKFDRAGVGYVVGQMNEGAVATAVAVQAAMVVSPIVGELYGALGIENDPGSGVTYADGCVGVPKFPGLGITVERGLMSLLWDSDTVI
jgi:L-alanine-DL-glutamate epimerase-like enolase superfamily enzyme